MPLRNIPSLGIRHSRLAADDIPALYTLYDQLTTARSAGAVHGTASEPVGGTRTVVDTESKLTIASGELTFAGGKTTPGWGDPGLWYPAVTRALGRVVLGQVSNVATNVYCMAGWATGQSGLPGAHAFYQSGGNFRVYDNNQIDMAIGVYSAATTYKFAIVLRATGAFYFVKGGAFTNWTLIWISSLNSTATLFPGIINNTASFTADNPRVPKRLYIPVPLQSDGMSAATTNGLGNAENNGPVGNAYSSVGTFGVSGGVRSCSALSGGLGFSYLACPSSNVLLSAVCTRSAGVTGLVARYADSSNYLIAYLDGTNAKLDKVVAGVTTNLISAGVTYGAAFVLRLKLDGTEARLWYNAIAVGGLVTVPAAGSLNHGVYTSDTGATFDNLQVWARGNSETQYSGLDSL